MIDLPFPYRLLLLAGTFGVLALLHRRDRSRWKEYLFVFVAGGAGAAFGVANDLITSAISPAYFEIAKGIRGGEGFVARVAGLGFQAGFVAGASIACAYLCANNPRAGLPRMRYQRLFRMLVLPAVAALFVGLLAGASCTFVDPYPLVHWLDVLVPVQEARAFLAVAAIHAGLYVGLVIGVVLSVRGIRHQRVGATRAIPNRVPGGGRRWQNTRSKRRFDVQSRFRYRFRPRRRLDHRRTTTCVPNLELMTTRKAHSSILIAFLLGFATGQSAFGQTVFEKDGAYTSRMLTESLGD